MEYVQTGPDAIHAFSQTISSFSLPEKFTFPFCYDAHPLAKIAAAQVQDFLDQSYDNEHNFGIDPRHEGIVIGKMFGVLVVKKLSGELGFVAAYSGKLAEGKQHPYFVPPVYDVFEENGMYQMAVKDVVALNTSIEEMEQNKTFIALNKQLQELEEEAEREITKLKNQRRLGKKERQKQRTESRAVLPDEEYVALLENLKNESLKQQFDIRVITAFWQEKINTLDSQFRPYREKIERWKEERKVLSARIQTQLFQNYGFLNAKNEWKSLLAIFTDDLKIVPPAGAGECAAPKLLQYAYLNKLEPVAMAEFWWGASPKSEIRKHGEFYPACNTKCGPILGFMLQGLLVDENPLKDNRASSRELQIVFEDEHILVLNKPGELLSVPGRFVTDSVQTRVRAIYPEAILVHRLDQSTSGIILAAKNYQSYVNLQKQFTRRTVKKRYLAVLNGILERDKGEIDLPLRVDLDNRPQQMVCYDYGKSAKTLFSVKKRQGAKTHVHFYPVTGRTHQLRMHAAHPLGLNIPIMGDDLYGQKHDRLYLHAEYLEFDHPESKERLSFTVPAEFDSII